MAFITVMIGRFQSNSGLDNWKAAKKVLHYMASHYMQGTEDYMITYKRYDNLQVVGYSDVDYVGRLDSKKSTPSYVFTLA